MAWLRRVSSCPEDVPVERLESSSGSNAGGAIMSPQPGCTVSRVESYNCRIVPADESGSSGAAQRRCEHLRQLIQKCPGRPPEVIEESRETTTADLPSGSSSPFSIESPGQGGDFFGHFQFGDSGLSGGFGISGKDRSGSDQVLNKFERDVGSLVHDFGSLHRVFSKVLKGLDKEFPDLFAEGGRNNTPAGVESSSGGDKPRATDAKYKEFAGKFENI
eukprot:jgi/Chlat1/6313/Chrsp44S05885